MVNASVNPSPIPNPSKNEGTGPFFAANASARPSKIQFTTINGINNPKVAYSAGTYACIIICNKVTNDAITTMNAGIRTISGIRFLIDEITTFEQINTNMVASPIPIPLMAEEVVPNVGHIPKRSTNVGFSLTIPFINTLKLFIVCSFLIFCFYNLALGILLFYSPPCRS